MAVVGHVTVSVLDMGPLRVLLRRFAELMDDPMVDGYTKGRIEDIVAEFSASVTDVPDEP